MTQRTLEVVRGLGGVAVEGGGEVVGHLEPAALPHHALPAHRDGRARGSEAVAQQPRVALAPV